MINLVAEVLFGLRLALAVPVCAEPRPCAVVVPNVETGERVACMRRPRWTGERSMDCDAVSPGRRLSRKESR